MNEQIYILLAQEGGPGGLFDIGATLPLVALQFLILMFVLNSILYNQMGGRAGRRGLDNQGYILPILVNFFYIYKLFP